MKGQRKPIGVNNRGQSGKERSIDSYMIMQNKIDKQLEGDKAGIDHRRYSDNRPIYDRAIYGLRDSDANSTLPWRRG